MVQAISGVQVNEGDYRVYGNASRLFLWLEGYEKPPTREVLIEGPAGTGKTRAVCEFLVECCNRYPGTKILLFRKTRVSLSESILDCLEGEVLGPEHPVVLGGPSRAHRDKYVFPNGSEIVLGGMDNATRLFSTQYHIAHCNEATEIEQDEWELMHRALRRPQPGPPFYLLMGDLNPDTSTHWANLRSMPIDGGAARCTRIVTYLWDNPRWYDHEKAARGVPPQLCWTPEGEEYLLGLGGGMSGVRRDRMFRGLWVAAEGMVWETYDPSRHLITARLEGTPATGITLYKRLGFNERFEPVEVPIPLGWFACAHDWGTRNPGSMQVWGFDREGNAYLVAEQYHQGKDYSWWADRAVEFYREFKYVVGLCDHAPAAIPVFNALCSRVDGRDAPAVWREWTKIRGEDGEKTGIDAVRTRFRQDALFIVRGALRQADPYLRQKRKPLCLEDELPQFVYPVTADGKRHKETPDKGCANHAADTCRGTMSWAFLKDLSPAIKVQEILAKPGTIEHAYEERFRERLRPKRKKDNSW